MPNLSLADKIVDASKTGSIVPELTALDAIVEAALNALGTKINSILTALKAFKIVASS